MRTSQAWHRRGEGETGIIVGAVILFWILELKFAPLAYRDPTIPGVQYVPPPGYQYSTEYEPVNGDQGAAAYAPLQTYWEGNVPPPSGPGGASYAPSPIQGYRPVCDEATFSCQHDNDPHSF